MKIWDANEKTANSAAKQGAAGGILGVKHDLDIQPIKVNTVEKETSDVCFFSEDVKKPMYGVFYILAVESAAGFVLWAYTRDMPDGSSRRMHMPCLMNACTG